MILGNDQHCHYKIDDENTNNSTYHRTEIKKIATLWLINGASDWKLDRSDQKCLLKDRCFDEHNARYYHLQFTEHKLIAIACHCCFISVIQLFKTMLILTKGREIKLINSAFKTYSQIMFLVIVNPLNINLTFFKTKITLPKIQNRKLTEYSFIYLVLAQLRFPPEKHLSRHNVLRLYGPLIGNKFQVEPKADN